MTAGGSQQLRIYRMARAAGEPPTLAAMRAGISVAEARLIDEADAREPPPPDAFELISLPAGSTGATATEDDMARRKAVEDQVQEIKKPDFKRALRILRNDIEPAQEKVAEQRGDLSAAWKMIADDCHVNKAAAREFNKIRTMSDEKRDDYLRSLYGLMKEAGVGISEDLVDRMGDEETPTMPVAKSREFELHTVN